MCIIITVGGSTIKEKEKTTKDKYINIKILILMKKIRTYDKHRNVYNIQLLRKLF